MPIAEKQKPMRCGEWNRGSFVQIIARHIIATTEAQPWGESLGIPKPVPFPLPEHGVKTNGCEDETSMFILRSFLGHLFEA